MRRIVAPIRRQAALSIATIVVLLFAAPGWAWEPVFDGDLCIDDPPNDAGTAPTHYQFVRSEWADFSGPCRFFTEADPDTVRVCNPDTAEPFVGELFFYLVRGDNWGQDSSGRERSVVADHWKGVERDVPVTTLGNRVGIVCHNCYFDRYAAERDQPHECVGGSTPGQACQTDDDCDAGTCEWNDLDASLDYLHQAQANGGDALELDLQYGLGTSCSTPNAPDIEVRHGSWEGPCFADLLADDGLYAGDQLLFIESKGNPSEEQLEQLLCMFLPAGEQPPACGDIPRYPDYAREGRPLFLRALWSDRAFIESAYDKLREEPFSALRDHVRLHLSFLRTETPTAEGTLNSIDRLAPKVDGFEFDFLDVDLFGKIGYVRSLGLPVAVFGNKQYCFGDMYVAALREDVDFLIVDYPVGMARKVAEEDNRLLYMNVGEQYQPWTTSGAPTAVEYWDRDSRAPKALPLTPTTPRIRYWSRGMAEDLFGGVLDFDETQWLTFEDDDDRLDNWSCGGYLVTAVINHDGGQNTTDEIVSKAENSAFFLDLHPDSDPFSDSGYLRFGTHADGSYQIARGSAALLDGENSYLLIGAYDGHGKARLCCNGCDSDGSTYCAVDSSDSITHAGVATNDYPVVLGANPGPGGSVSQFFDGKMQQVALLAWGNHPTAPDAPERYQGQNILGDCNPVAHIDIEKAVNARNAVAPTREEDADSFPGPEFEAGGTLTFSYLLTNPGSEPLDMTGAAITDTDAALVVTAVMSGGHNIGDTNGDGMLDPGEVWRYGATKTAAPGAFSSEAGVAISDAVSDCDRIHLRVR